MMFRVVETWQNRDEIDPTCARIHRLLSKTAYSHPYELTGRLLLNYTQ